MSLARDFSRRAAMAAGLLLILQGAAPPASSAPASTQTSGPAPGPLAAPSPPALLASAPVAPGGLAATPPAPAPTSAAPAPRPTTPVRVRRDPPPGYALAKSANAEARAYPASGIYVNAALFYAFEPGRLYTLQTSPRYLTAIALRPGEKLISKAAGDVVRWVLGETTAGSGDHEQVVVMLRPNRGGLRTNVILTTDQRTYLLDAVSYDGDVYTPLVSWTYPQEQMQEALKIQKAAETAKAAAAVSEVAQGLTLEQLHFNYAIEPLKTPAPHWAPLRVFDDGTKTYIQFPINMAATDAPPLFMIGPGDKAELVNYRYLNGYYIVDRLMDVAELRLGEKPQAVVRIVRGKDRG